MRFVYIPLLMLLAMACNRNPGNNSTNRTHPDKFKQISFLLYENFDTALLHTAITEAAAFYHCKATILSSQNLPAFAYIAARYRYKADSLLKFQSGLLPKGSDAVVGITNKDISTSLGDKKDWGIFGLGYCPGKACVISVFRLKTGTYDEYIERFVKVLLHELGHNMGLPHCKADSLCLMTDANGRAATVDKENKWLCPGCRKQLSN